MSAPKKVSPVDGGCWFCFEDYEPMIFDTEFDTYLHKDCLKKAIEKDPEDGEAQVMGYLLGR